MSTKPRHALRCLALAIAAVAAALALAAPASAAAPAWEISAHHAPGAFAPDSRGEYTLFVTNIGDASAKQVRDDQGTEDPSDDTFTDQIKLEVDFPPGVTTRIQNTFVAGEGTWFNGYGAAAPKGWDCGPSVADAGSIGCTSLLDQVRPGAKGLGILMLYLDVAPDASVDPLEAEITVEGGGAPPRTLTHTVPLGPAPDRFGIAPGSLEAEVFGADTLPTRQAGSHPFRAVSGFDFNMESTLKPFVGAAAIWPTMLAIDTVRNVDVDLPPGLVGNPQAVAKCTAEQFPFDCPADSQVGTVQVLLRLFLSEAIPPTFLVSPLFNMVPVKGELARFGFEFDGRQVFLKPTLDPTDYSVTIAAHNLVEITPVYLQRVTIWGNPADPAHDFDRKGRPFEGPAKPLLSLPTECNTPDVTTVSRLDSWQDTGINVGPYAVDPISLFGCDQLEFEPKVEVKPTTNVAGAPTGLEFDLHIPQSEDPNGFATAHLRDAVVKLPAGMSVNPPSADGLSACSLAQIGIAQDGTPNGNPVTCPEASKLGTVRASSPPVDHPLNGTVYLAEQNANPFGSLLAMYLAIEDPQTGVLIKLPGRVDPDQSTGQLTATFRNNPQLPVEDLHLELFQGPRAALKTPDACGLHTTEATLTPWSSPEGAEVSSPSSFELTQGPAGGACLPSGAQAPNTRTFLAGTEDPTAKAFSPFVLKLARADGSQQLRSIETTLPKGLVAKLAGTTYCSDGALAAASGKSGKDEKASASCPASSHVGSVNVGAGAGSTPLYVSGQAYLAGPYKGAPLSLAIITPAVAGPFDLGTVVVRTALQVNPESAQVRAVSDELPTILQGIPLNIRSIALKLDRPQFTLNPTSCDPMSIDGSALSVFNQSASLTNHFQLGECNKLGFKPKLAIRLKGSTKRAGHPALTATLSARPGDANIAKAIVALPHSEFLAQDHIRTICTRVQFAANQCPKGSVYGTASAITPLLDEPLSGNVYLRSSNNPLPDIVIALRGKIDIDLVGRIDSDKRGGIRTSFESVPDAPVSRFTLRMAGGRKSLLENSKNLCRSTNKATVQMSAQNGIALDSRPVVKSAGCKGKGRKGGKARGGKGGKRGGERGRADRGADAARFD